MLFRVFILVSVGLVASASLKNSRKPQEVELSRTQDQMVRAGRHGPLQIVPQAWYENAIVAVSF